MAQQAQRNEVEQAASWLLAEMRDSPARDEAVEEHTTVGFVAELAAATGPAAHVETPEGLESDLRPVRAQDRLERTVCSQFHQRLRLEIWVTVVDAPQRHNPKAEDLLAHAAGERGDVVSVTDVVAVRPRREP